MKTVMVTVRSEQPPTLPELQARFGLDASDVDAAFGVIEIDPDEHLYTFAVDAAKAASISPGHAGVEGTYSNPVIAPFGPPQT